MKNLTRRGFMATGTLALAGCAAGSGKITGTASQIDIHVRDALEEMYQTFPGSREFAQRATGMLVIPNVTKAGLFLGGSYGEGALLIGDATVDYYSFASASFGLLIGAQQSRQVLFFMTPEVLRDFRVSDGFELGVDAEFAVQEEGARIGMTSTTSNKPILGIVFGQRGFLAGASLEGAKYSRLIR
ncbi:MAG: lipid-binding SYLF domain-containing protein [Rhodobacteraceae bacterium]|nr:lipid-binding SYLF domain-containing protein [Paracoccaceae bacterium]